MAGKKHNWDGEALPKICLHCGVSVHEKKHGIGFYYFTLQTSNPVSVVFLSDVPRCKGKLTDAEFFKLN